MFFSQILVGGVTYVGEGGGSPLEVTSRTNQIHNGPFSSSRKESELKDVMMHFEEFSNVHNSNRTCNSTRSNLAYKIV